MFVFAAAQQKSSLTHLEILSEKSSSAQSSPQTKKEY